MGDHQFNGKTALITGAATGIGYEIAEQLGKKGVGIVLNDRDESSLQSAASRLLAQGIEVVPVPGDAASLLLIDQMIDTTVARFGRLDFCVANAGITLFGDFLSYTPDRFSQVMDLNLKGSFFLAQKSALEMVSRCEGGRILLMSSVTGVQSHSNLSVYGISKAALTMMAKTIGVELASYGITVNALAPGATLTARTQGLDPDYEKIWMSLTPRGKVATVHDIASAALFLLSDEACHITGQTIVIDGGWTAVSPSPEH